MHLLRDPFSEARGRAALRVVCIGNRWRSDDAAGLAVAEGLRGTLPEGVALLECEGEPTALIDAWEGAELVWLVDAVSSGDRPGTIHRLDASEHELPAALFRASTHHVGLSEAVELARALSRLPRQTVVFGIEGGDFQVGNVLSDPVALAVGQVVEAVRKEVDECMRKP